MGPATWGCMPDAVCARQAFPARAGFQYPVAKRDETDVDGESLLKALERLSFLDTEISDLAELHINPLLVDASGCKAVDARIIW